jgi:hypothetical protein
MSSLTKAVAGDREVAARLWQISEELCRHSSPAAISRVGGPDA